MPDIEIIQPEIERSKNCLKNKIETIINIPGSTLADTCPWSNPS